VISGKTIDNLSKGFIKKNLSFFQPTSSLRELTILFEIGQTAHTTQSQLAKKASIVPAMANKYIKQLMKSGYVKTVGSTNRDMRYYLTSKGHTRMMRLMQKYCNETISLYIKAKEEIKQRLNRVLEEGHREIVLYGAAETGEIALTAGDELGFDILAVVDGNPGKHGKSIGRKKVKAPAVIRKLKPDAVVISSFGHQEQIYEQIKDLESLGIAIRRL
jgi:DNA-binding MarR family transcriptional regulator